jgi:hypothetical protein
MKKLFVHAGLHKTGTTAIQKFIYQNRSGLFREFETANRYEEDFLKVPDTLVVRTIVDEISAGGSPTPPTAAAFERVLGRLLDSPKPFALLTDETLLGVHVGREDSREFYPHLRKRAEAVANLFSAFEISLIIYVRDAVGWKKSVYNQLLKTLATEMTFEEFQAVYNIPENFRDSILSRIPADIFSAVRLLSYEEEFKKDTRFPMGFLREVGLSNTDGAVELGRENSAPEKGNLLLIQHHLFTCRIAGQLIAAGRKKEAEILLRTNMKICNSPKSAALLQQATG